MKVTIYKDSGIDAFVIHDDKAAGLIIISSEGIEHISTYDVDTPDEKFIDEMKEKTKCILVELQHASVIV